MVDAKTKALSAKMTRQSPTLAKLLTKALEEGVISPDVVASLESAARNINEDVAFQLGHAARDINEDVARSLMYADERINPTVAQQLASAAESLSKAAKHLDFDDLRKLVDRLDGAQGSLSGTVGQMDRVQSGGPFGRIDHITSALNSAADRIERVVTPPPPKIIIDRKAQLYSFLWVLALAQRWRPTSPAASGTRAPERHRNGLASCGCCRAYRCCPDLPGSSRAAMFRRAGHGVDVCTRDDAVRGLLEHVLATYQRGGSVSSGSSPFGHQRGPITSTLLSPTSAACQLRYVGRLRRASAVCTPVPPAARPVVREPHRNCP